MAQTVCDIQFFLPSCFTTAQTNTVTPDGAIAVFATASGVATIKYYLITINAGGGGGGGGSDFDYDTQGQTSGVFSGLVAGSYRVIARNSNSCKAQADFTVALSDDLIYGIRFTNRYYGLRENGYTPAYWKIDIKKRNYSGTTDEVQMKFALVQGVAGIEDPFQTIFPSAVEVELLAQTDGQFEELYTEDDREFMVVVYLHNGSDWDVWWAGYGVTGEYSAPYDTQNNTPITFRAADMLENLRQIPFGNENEVFPQLRMSIMDGILMALQRTDIELDIYEGIQYVIDGVSNTFDETSAVEEAYFDPLTYFNNGEAESCYDVLDSLLKSMSARLYQAEGRWNIESVTMKSGGTFNVRTRDFDGEETDAGYLETEPRLLVRKSGAPGERLVFQDRTQAHKISQTYGDIDVIYEYGLKEEQSLTNADFVAVDEETGQYKDWEISSNTLTQIVSSESVAGEDIHALKIQFDAEGEGQEVTIISAPIPLVETTEPYKLEFSFDVKAIPYIGTYTFFDLAISVSGGSPDDYHVMGIKPLGGEGANAFLDDSFVSDYLIEDEYLRFYADQVGNWQSFSLFVVVDPVIAIPGGVSGDLQLKFRVGENPIYDHADITALKAEVTDDQVIRLFDTRRRVAEGSRINEYKLVAGSDSESLPDIVRPTDYDIGSPYVWKLQTSFTTPSGVTALANTFRIKNVVTKYLPDQAQPDESETYAAIVNSQTRQSLDVTIRHGDLPADHNYQNFSRGWLSFSDGTPTNGRWKLRPATAGPNTQRRPLIQRVSTHLRGQYIARRWKETGAFSTMRKVPSFFNTFYEVRTGKVFVPLYMRVDSKNASCDIEMIEVIQGTAIADSGVIDPVNPDIPIEPPPEEAGRIHVAAFATAFY